jgi:hypothetical protein
MEWIKCCLEIVINHLTEVHVIPCYAGSCAAFLNSICNNLHSDPKEHGILNSICNNLHSDPKEHGILNSICNNLHSDPKEHGKR